MAIAVNDSNFEEEEDFTTYSLGKDDLMNLILKRLY